MLDFPFIVSAVRDGSWYWGLGDPDAGAILVTFLYFITGSLCFFVARRLHLEESAFHTKSEVFFWIALGTLLILLGINKQADLQSLITLYGRDLFKYFGLYKVRRTFQIAFIAIVALIGSIVVALALSLVRYWNWCCKIAVMGLGFQSAFVVIRAASFHQVDQWLGIRLLDMKMNLILESIGLVLILLSAANRHRILNFRVDD